MVGPTRSGKTVLCRLLATQADFHHFEEPIGLWNIGKKGRKDDARDADEATPRVAHRIRTSMARRLAEVGARRWVDDLPHHALRIAFCLRVLPDARLIQVLRDGRESVPEMIGLWGADDSLRRVVTRKLAGRNWRSLHWPSLPGMALKWAGNQVSRRLLGRRRSWGPTVPGQVEFSRDRSIAQIAAFQWSVMATMSLDGVAQAPPEQVLTVRRENLLADPAGEAERIAAFVDTPAPPLRDLFTQRIGVGASPKLKAMRESVPPEVWDEILPIIAPVQARLGYA